MAEETIRDVVMRIRVELADRQVRPPDTRAATAAISSYKENAARAMDEVRNRIAQTTEVVDKHEVSVKRMSTSAGNAMRQLKHDVDSVAASYVRAADQATRFGSMAYFDQTAARSGDAFAQGRAMAARGERMGSHGGTAQIVGAMVGARAGMGAAGRVAGGAMPTLGRAAGGAATAARLAGMARLGSVLRIAAAGSAGGIAAVAGIELVRFLANTKAARFATEQFKEAHKGRIDAFERSIPIYGSYYEAQKRNAELEKQRLHNLAVLEQQERKRQATATAGRRKELMRLDFERELGSIATPAARLHGLEVERPRIQSQIEAARRQFRRAGQGPEAIAAGEHLGRLVRQRITRTQERHDIREQLLQQRMDSLRDRERDLERRTREEMQRMRALSPGGAALAGDSLKSMAIRRTPELHRGFEDIQRERDEIDRELREMQQQLELTMHELVNDLASVKESVIDLNRSLQTRPR